MFSVDSICHLGNWLFFSFLIKDLAASFPEAVVKGPMPLKSLSAGWQGLYRVTR